MKHFSWLRSPLAIVGAVLGFGIAANAQASQFAFGGHRWKEEVLLHDASKVIVSRTVILGGKHELGQEPPIKEQSLSFIHPGTGDPVLWQDKFVEDVGSASFLPMLLDVHGGAVYLVAQTMGCLSYNKWGRPNPPYVIFRYEEKSWERIDLHELPAEIKNPNLIFSSPHTEAKRLGAARTIPAPAIRALYDNYKRLESRTILRQPIPESRLCPDWTSERYRSPKPPLPLKSASDR